MEGMLKNLISLFFTSGTSISLNIRVFVLFLFRIPPHMKTKQHKHKHKRLLYLGPALAHCPGKFITDASMKNSEAFRSYRILRQDKPRV